MSSIRDYIRDELKTIYSSSEISTITQMILGNKLNISLVDSMTCKFNNLSDAQRHIVSEIIGRLKQLEPIQYILGETEFYNLKFAVNKDVLIPRPETEELIEWIIEDEKNHNITILDIGTGSGCIAISLAKQMPQAKVSACDISHSALEVAQTNATTNGVDISFSQMDILQTNSSNQPYNVIVSNPPYITHAEQEIMHNTVTKFEPSIALFVPNNNPLLFYKQIAHFATNTLTPQGRLYLEINQYFAEETKQMLTQKGFTQVELRNDLAGNPRMIKAIKP